MPVAEVRADLSRLVDDAVRSHEPFDTRDGKDAAVLLAGSWLACAS